MTEITPAALSARLYDGGADPFVVDIRHTEEFEEWHIPGSENIDVYEELKTESEEAKDALSGLPDDEEIVTVCAAGVISQQATDILREMGYDAKTLVDGMNGWSRVHRSARIELPIEGTVVQVARPGKGCLSHVLISDREAVVFDPSQYRGEYESVVAAHDVDLVGVFDTHAHADHVSGGADLAASHDVPYYLHPDDALAIDATPLEDGETVEVGSVAVEVIHTPGHSDGAVSFEVGGEALVTGDTLFHESVGRVELGVAAGLDESDVEDNAAALYDSLQRLLDRPDDTVVLPAHDPGAPEPPVSATLGEVRERNPDLQRDRESFIEKLASDVPEHPPNFERVKRTNVGVEEVPDDELADLELGPNRCAAE